MENIFLKLAIGGWNNRRVDMGEIENRKDRLVKEISQTNIYSHEICFFKMFLALLYAVSIWSALQ